MKKILLSIFSFLVCLFSIQAQTLYGTTFSGGVSEGGTINKFSPATNNLTVAYSFDRSNPVDGFVPTGTLVHTNDGKLYGVTALGGSNGFGVLFSFDPSLSVYTKLEDFVGTNGNTPNGALLQANDGKLYGMTQKGGSFDVGIIYSFDPSASLFTKLVDFDTINGATPYGSLIQANDGKIYGMTSAGGTNNGGVIFSFDPLTSIYTKMRDFDEANGIGPLASFLQAKDGKLYGTTVGGGSAGYGVIFAYDPSTSIYTKLKDIDNLNSDANPRTTLIQGIDGILYGTAWSSDFLFSGVIFSFDLSDSAYRVAGFNFSIGIYPGSLIQASNGKIYGMTAYGPTADLTDLCYGVVFSFDPSSFLITKLIDFNAVNGSTPYLSGFIEVSECIGDKPTFGFDFNGTPVANINNGSADPGESASVTVCDGGDYFTSGHFHSSSSNMYYINNTGTGGGLLFNGIAAPASTGVYTSDQLTNTAGIYAISLADPNIGGTLTQTITPFTDLNNSGSLDAGDCAGEPILFTYTATPKTTWYKDTDGDQHASDTIRSCTSPGEGWTMNKLPVDDCNDNDASNTGPTFGFNFNGTPVANINNGSADPGESASVTVCDGGNYFTSGHFHSSLSNLYIINNIASGSPLLFNGVNATAGTVSTAAQLSNTAGTYTITLANPNITGTLKQTITPFTDLNHSGNLDAGDCAGDPILFTYTVTPGSKTWYKDADGDGYGNPNCHLKACTRPAGYVANNRDCDDNNRAVHAPVTFYRDADRDGFGDATISISLCKNFPPEGYVKNNFDCDDHKRSHLLWYEKIRMCHNGKAECVYLKDIFKKLWHGWTLGPCTSSCDNISSRATPGVTANVEKYSDDQLIPQQYKLSNYPNPFAGTSTIRYELPFDSKVTIKVYDLAGRTVATLVDENKKAGIYTVDFNAGRLNKGSLYYRIIATSKDDRFEQTNKMIQLR